MSRLLSERNRLEGLLRRELSGQAALLELLRRQEAAVISRTPEPLAEVTECIERELASAAAHRLEREPVMQRLAGLLGVAPTALTLGSLIERLGEDGQRLQPLRDELRDMTAKVVRHNRRVAALVGLHRRLNQEVLEHLLAQDDSNPLERSGALVDAEV